jgi:hydroxymethylcytosylglucuronate/cytosylglucuronate synthase
MKSKYAVPRVLVSVVDFGFGSAGKLSSIMDFLPGYEFVWLGASQGKRIVDPDRFSAWYPDLAASSLHEILATHEIKVALVILDHDLAVAIEKLGTPVVFVDSLPHLWTECDAIAYDVTCYCAQMSPSIPDSAWPVLRRIANLHWIEGIVPEVNSIRGAEVGAEIALVNLGGLQSPGLPTAGGPYFDLVLPAALSALAEAGYQQVNVTGNLPESQPTAREHISVTQRCVPHKKMQQLINGADLVLTSPGLTTALELGATEAKVVFLPPQNVSQVLLTRILRNLCPAGCAVTWPDTALDTSLFEAARRQGEKAALQVVYDSIESLAGTGDGYRVITDHIRHAISAPCMHDSSRLLLEVMGSGGAQQVAQMVGELAAREEPER